MVETYDKKEFVTNDHFERSMEQMMAFLRDFRDEMNTRFSDMEAKMDEKIDNLVVTKADREEVFALHKRVVKLEKKAA